MFRIKNGQCQNVLFYSILNFQFSIKVVAFPNCKINLGLNIIGKRNDGFHDLETVFYPIEFNDVLEIIADGNDSNELTVTGLPVIGAQNNLCSKAYDLLKKDYPHLPFVKIHLHKVIPTGAGLGGGSSDAAFTLELLNEKFLMGLTRDQLKKYALQLGSDCPFFLDNKPCFASARGEQLKAVDLHLSKYKIMLVNPGIHICTSWAFSAIKPVKPAKSVKAIIHQPLTTWKQELINDFEVPVFENYPEIKIIKETLYKNGALYASLTGSGSTVFGIFDKTYDLHIKFPDSYFSRIINLK